MWPRIIEEWARTIEDHPFLMAFVASLAAGLLLALMFRKVFWRVFGSVFVTCLIGGGLWYAISAGLKIPFESPYVTGGAIGVCIVSAVIWYKIIRRIWV